MGKDTAAKQQFWTPEDRQSQQSKQQEQPMQLEERNELDDLEDAGLEFANAAITNS